MIELADPASAAGDRYLLLADISGYTAFMASIEQAHGVDFSAGIPAGFEVLGALLGTVIEGLQPQFAIAKLEGDAVFAVAPAAVLDGRGDEVTRSSAGSRRSTRRSTNDAPSGLEPPGIMSVSPVRWSVRWT